MQQLATGPSDLRRDEAHDLRRGGDVTPHPSVVTITGSPRDRTG
jgi:hypothetical protein